MARRARLPSICAALSVLASAPLSSACVKGQARSTSQPEEGAGTE
ncbi:hypothetical protein PPSIR1_24324 [Plesiocystis pacifica SIR-1]|uniref:Uncharacterized protein n=1 Tax=Plesiocystis pacifica SIR-1 TaxID=391625 RepID=A6GC29_9BACT|nr:hypothetical protein [Plesiocystis pacifica]EDM76591.1 hypothetical protein PPSIR1_24324 [Plesiocystis pacifica SIR-1]